MNSQVAKSLIFLRTPPGVNVSKVKHPSIFLYHMLSQIADIDILS